MALKGGCDYRRCSPQQDYQADEQTRSAINGQWGEISKVGNERQLRKNNTRKKEKDGRVLRL